MATSADSPGCDESPRRNVKEIRKIVDASLNDLTLFHDPFIVAQPHIY